MDNNENNNEFKLSDGNYSSEIYKKKKKNLNIPGIIVGIIIILIAIVIFKKFFENNNQPPNLNKNIFSNKNNSTLTKQAHIPIIPNTMQVPITTKNNNIGTSNTIQKTPNITLAEPTNTPVNNNTSVKKNISNINDLFKLKNESNPINKTTTQPYNSNYPRQIPGQMQNPNFNGISPNIIQNIKSKINNIRNNYNSSGPIVIGVSNNFVVINYNGADLYLKSGDSFGNCTVMSMTSFNVKIACNNKLKKYPIEFIKNNTKAILNNTITGVKK